MLSHSGPVTLVLGFLIRLGLSPCREGIPVFAWTASSPAWSCVCCVEELTSQCHTPGGRACGKIPNQSKPEKWWWLCSLEPRRLPLGPVCAVSRSWHHSVTHLGGAWVRENTKPIQTRKVVMMVGDEECSSDWNELQCRCTTRLRKLRLRATCSPDIKCIP
jgi:hypothetical protein